MPAPHVTAAEIEAVNVPVTRIKIEIAEAVPLMIEIGQKPMIKICKRVDMIIAVVAPLTDIISIRVIHELNAPEMINTVDVMAGHHQPVHRPVIVIILIDTIIKNHITKNRRKNIRRNHRKNMTARTMIAILKREQKKVNVNDQDRDKSL